MANSIYHSLAFPVRGARYTIPVGYLDADGDPTDPVTPDTEVSKDGGAFVDCTEEVTVIAGGNGCGYLTLTGDEMNANLVIVCAKVASGPKATLAFIQPRAVASFVPATPPLVATGGGLNQINLAMPTPPILAEQNAYLGYMIRTVGGPVGPAGGGLGSRDNQARLVTNYSAGQFFTTTPFEVAPVAGTIFELCMTEFCNLRFSDLRLWRGTVPAPVIGNLAFGRLDAQVGAMAPDVLTATALDATAVAEIQAGLASQASVTTINDLLDPEIAQIKTNTDLIPGLSLAVGDVPTADENAAALLDLADGAEPGFTVRQALRLLIGAEAGKLAGAATTTITIRNVGDSKNRIIATVTEEGDRLAMVYDLS